MPMSLGNRLNDLAASFTARVLDAIRGVSLEELLSLPTGGLRTPHVPARGEGRGHAGASAATSAAPLALARKRGGRLPRRSAGDISQSIDRIVELLTQNPSGLRAEEIRQKLGLEAKELPRPLKEGLSVGKFSKVGQKRATTYFAASAGASAKPAGRRGRK